MAMADQLDIVDALRKMVDSRLYEINTSIPGVIVSYSNGRAKVKPTPKKRFPDGDVLDFPILQNVRVCWPSFSGGTAGVKGPIKPGDKCLIVIAQQAVDGTDDPRRFDMSDAYVIPCDLGSAAGQSSDNSGMTMFFGSAFIRLTESGALLINAPGGTTVTTPSLTNSGTLTNAGAATLQSTLQAGQSTLSGASIGGISFASHRHTGVATGSGTSGGPI